MEVPGLDAKDNAIISLLREDARLSYSEIGERVGLSRVAVRNRIMVLEENGIIRGYHAQTDPLAMPESLPFIVEMTTDAPSFQSVSEKLAADKRVITLCEISPGCTLHALCLAKSKEDLKWFLSQFRDSDPGVLRIAVSEIYDVKKGSVFPF